MDWIIGISSTVIALSALGYTVWQGKQAQKHNKMSFRPHLSSFTHTTSSTYSVTISNNGLGPALIESFTIKIDGKIISGEKTEPIKKGLKILFPKAQYQSQKAYLGKGYLMAAKENITILDIQFTGNPLPTQEVIEHSFNRVALIIKYKSFYDEKFTYPPEEDDENE